LAKHSDYFVEFAGGCAPSVAVFPVSFSWGRITFVPLPFLSFDGPSLSGIKQPLMEKARIDMGSARRRPRHFILGIIRESINRVFRLYFLKENFMDLVYPHWDPTPARRQRCEAEGEKRGQRFRFGFLRKVCPRREKEGWKPETCPIRGQTPFAFMAATLR
jgi:hypothetical protein